MTDDERAMVLARCSERFGLGEFECRPVPTLDDIELPAPRVAIPEPLAGFSTDTATERALHTYGKSFPDYVRMFDRDLKSAPDFVAYPRSETDIEAVFDWATGKDVAVVPFGGGTTVVGGVEPVVGGGFQGAISLDLTKLDQVLEIDKTSRAARIQAGIFVPALEAALRPEGLTLRHFPQSFQMATLGGMIATRSGGHFATLYTHIDDFVESTRTVTPAGVMESRRLPGSGAGPSPDRLMIGSEGALGVITEAWMRLQDRPSFRASATVLFADYVKAAEAVRIICQAGLYPANVRLLDAGEAANNGFGDGQHSVLILAFESADHPLDAWVGRAVEIARDYGGVVDVPEGGEADAHLKGAAGAWRNAFIRMPYFRELLVSIGVISDTFESAVTWDRFPEFHAKVMAATQEAVVEATGKPGTVTCRFTHCYPDGPAPYYSFQALGDSAALLDQWTHIKKRASDAVVACGGTITHHHAVGRDHMPWYEKQVPELFRSSIAGAKTRLDPTGILNPGVIVPSR
jgi:alkyldihydroxyacetonephosphate synthase